MSAGVNVVLARVVRDLRQVIDDLAVLQVEEPACGYAASLLAERANDLQEILDRRQTAPTIGAGASFHRLHVVR